METEKVVEILQETGVMSHGHFLLTSGRHSDTYVQCAHLFEHPGHTEKMAAELAKRYQDKEIDVVVGPAIGGIILAYEVARQLGVRNVFTEREDGKMTLRRNFEIKPGQRVLIVEDVITTGGSVMEVVELAQNLGAEVVGIGVVVDRSGGTVDFDVPLDAVISMDVQSFIPDECPICANDGTAPIKPGSRGQA